MPYIPSPRNHEWTVVSADFPTATPLPLVPRASPLQFYRLFTASHHFLLLSSSFDISNILSSAVLAFCRNQPYVIIRIVILALLSKTWALSSVFVPKLCVNDTDRSSLRGFYSRAQDILLWHESLHPDHWSSYYWSHLQLSSPVIYLDLYVELCVFTC